MHSVSVLVWTKAIWWPVSLPCAFLLTWIPREKSIICRQGLESYITGNIPGCPCSLERDSIQPEVIAASPVLLPGIPVDFLWREQEHLGEKQPLPECYLVSAGLNRNQAPGISGSTSPSEAGGLLPNSRVDGTGHKGFLLFRSWGSVSLACLPHPAIPRSLAPSMSGSLLCLTFSGS